MSLHARLAPRRSATVRSVWARWLTALVEEAAYAEADLKAGRRLARAGQVGEIAVAPGEVLAAVLDGDDAWSVRIAAPLLDEVATVALAEVVAAGSGWLGTLLRGGLPDALLEAAEEAGVEVLPYAGELETTCGCEAWEEPCRHAIALLTQLAWLVDADPLVLLALRGLEREDLLARLAELAGGPGPAADGDADDLAVAAEAAERAARFIEAVESGDDPARWV